MRIYIVYGYAGEYSSSSEWNVKAFKDEEKAKAFVLQLEDEARPLNAAIANDTYYNNKKWNGWKPPSDPDFQTDYTGTHYNYDWCELEE